MKSPGVIKITVAFLLILILSTCEERESTNPFDPDCPKELFTPSDLKSEQENNTVKLTWKQDNTHISGFIINRSANDGAMNEVAKIEKSVSIWNDNDVTGGSKYKYELLAYAGKNESNSVLTSINPVFQATVTTGSVTEITNTKAQVQGNVIGDGGSRIVERGFCYNTSPNPTIENYKKIVEGTSGVFNAELTGLLANTTYYIRAYVTNSKGTSYGNETNFITQAVNIPTAQTYDADFISMNSAALHGYVNANGFNTVVIFEYGTTTEYGDTISVEGELITGSTNTFITATVSELKDNTTYHFRVKATNHYGTTYGSDLFFTTEEKSAIPIEGLVAYYPFNGNANDESGNENDGTVNGAVLVNDRFGIENSAYHFDGSNDYIQISNSNSLNIKNTISISVWIKPTSFNIELNSVFQKWGDLSNRRQYCLTIKDERIEWYVSTTGYNYPYLKSSKTISTDTWTHIVVHYNSAQSKIYINGELDNEMAQNGAINISDIFLRIGGYGDDSEYLTKRYFNGIIDDIVVYNRALTEEEIQALYHEGGWGN